MKRLIVCCDGTWNNPDQEDNGIPAPTNVFKLHNAVAEGAGEGGPGQLRYYHPGVGGEGGLVSKVAGGAFGDGVTRHICSAYHWLGQHYAPGDEIFLFGFSRGAFTARCIGGFLGRGLLDLTGLTPAEAWKRVHAAFDQGYRQRETGWAGSWAMFHGGGKAPIRFLGVWDTVGALGIPDDLEVLNLVDNPRRWRFLDTTLGDHVQTARHAVAIDEVRSSFTPTLWGNTTTHADAKEVWFPGVHSDVGGGYAETDLSNGALLWMMEEATAAGLRFRDGVTAGLRPNALGVMHNSYRGVFKRFRSRPRNLPAMIPGNEAHFHPSALARQAVSPIAYPLYHPTRVLEVGETHSVDVFANTQWNATGLYLMPGHKYLLSAEGEWQDSMDTCDWRGTQNGNHTVDDLVRAFGSLLGKGEGLFERVTGNESTDFVLTKRVEALPWFTLVGAIANDGASAQAVTNDGSPSPHEYVELAAHEQQPFVCTRPGYLYCFPNDVWGLYGNNHGSIRLTVKRVG